MSTDILTELLQATLALSAAVLVLLILRKPLRSLVGAETAYRAWLLVPAAVLAVWLPARALAPDALATASPAGALLAVAGSPASAATTNLKAWALALWLMGAAVLMVIFAIRQYRFTRRVRRQPGQAFDLVDGHGPAVLGGWRMRVVLPGDFRQRYSAEEQRLILAHEQAHVARGDLHAQSLATALRCAFWFNPLVHYGAAMFRFDQELACDAAVLRQFPNARRHYGDAMLKTRLAGYGLPLACHWQASHSLKERITMLKQPLPTRARRISGALITTALLLGGSICAWAAQPGAARADSMPAPSAMGSITQIREGDDLSPPVYPAQAKAEGRSGRVLLALLVGADGRVKDVRVLSSGAGGEFESAAVEAARKWKVHPATKDGRRVESWVKVPVEFVPESSGT